MDTVGASGEWNDVRACEQRIQRALARWMAWCRSAADQPCCAGQGCLRLCAYVSSGSAGRIKQAGL